MPVGKRQMSETFSNRGSGHSVPLDTGKYSCQELHHKDKIFIRTILSFTVSRYRIHNYSAKAHGINH